MAANLPVAFGALLTGGLLLEKGLVATRDAFGGSGVSAASLTANVPSAGPATGGKQGAVAMSDLQTAARPYGWGAGELSAWWRVIAAESGGDPTSRNPTSGAFGIGQFLGSTLQQYAPYGATSSNPMLQLQAMARYIHDRYGTPSAAWAHEQSMHWY